MKTPLLRPEYLLRPQNVLRRIFLRRIHAGRSVTVPLPFSMALSVTEGEFVGNNIINTRCHDPALAECLWRLVQPGDVCVDVGANIGYTTLVMASRCGASGKCLAIEADPAIYRHLLGTIGLNALGDVVEARNVAASDTAGNVMFQRAAAGNTGLGRILSDDAGTDATGDVISVPALPLDGMLSCFEKIRVVKIDVEGHEDKVLAGITETLAARRVTHIVLEEHGGTAAASIRRLIAGGFTVFRLAKGFRGPLLAPADARTDPGLEPNFIATLDAAALSVALRPRGWHVL
jgi:FkbM family methyltransferase